MTLLGWSVVKVALALLAASGACGNPLTTIEPCPEAKELNLAPITVSTQYQPVSTCEPTTACIKGKCSTKYPFTTYPYVSTVVPCAWNGTTTQMATVTDISQPFKVSEYLETLTQVTTMPSNENHNRHGQKVTAYETVTRRAMAPFNEVAPFMIPGWHGSGLCKKCIQEDGSRSQLLDVIECRSGTSSSGKKYKECVEWYETVVAQPSTSVTTQARCASSGTIRQAGTYTWTFPQVAPAVTVPASPTTVTVTINGKPSVSVHSGVQVVPGQPWNAYVTKSFSHPTTFEFDIYVTKVVVLNIPYMTHSADSSRNVPIPTGSSKNNNGNQANGWWPLPEGPASWPTSYDGGQAWQDWNPTSSFAATSSSRLNGVSTKASSTPSGIVGPIGGKPSSSRSAIGLSTTGTVTSSGIVGPIKGSASSSIKRVTSSTLLPSSASRPLTSSHSAPLSPTASTIGASITSSSPSSSLSTVTGISSVSNPGGITTGSATSTTAVTASGTGFYLQISGTAVSALRPRQQVTQYLAFDSNSNGIAVNELSSAAFVFRGNDSTSFLSNSLFLGTSTLTESPVQRFLNHPTGFATWDIVGVFAQLRDTAGFCFDNGFVYAYTASDTCDNPIVIIVTNPTTTSTTSTASTGKPSTLSTSTKKTSTKSTTTKSTSHKTTTTKSTTTKSTSHKTTTTKSTTTKSTSHKTTTTNSTSHKSTATKSTSVTTSASTLAGSTSSLHSTVAPVSQTTTLSSASSTTSAISSSSTLWGILFDFQCVGRTNQRVNDKCSRTIHLKHVNSNLYNHVVALIDHWLHNIFLGSHHTINVADV
ncbi:hypothetical protein EDD36DRAFT_496271 [Exophiala viscosa]|uniref:Uncharacterized protein n=1 Tax=Exophiala viscosa TaxID=2486360 RepID=A0AAN6ID35_9EURO|nr:hypothetical protein EDD36DRAFT_496271 [Exophiala viscosa]